MSSNLWLLCGLPFSGKSTLAQGLAAATGARLISLDAINAERGVGHGGDGLPPEIWEQTHHIALERLAAAYAQGHSAILDDTSCFHWLRDRYRDHALAHGATVTLVVLATPPEEIAARIAANTATATRLGIKPAIYAAVAASFEWPGADEQPQHVAPDQIPEWLASQRGDAACAQPTSL